MLPGDSISLRLGTAGNLQRASGRRFPSARSFILAAVLVLPLYFFLFLSLFLAAKPAPGRSFGLWGSATSELTR